MALTWTDWRGHDYTVGDTILYARMSGRCCEMAEGVVVDLGVYVQRKYKWERLPDGEEIPTELSWRLRELATGDLYQIGWGGAYTDKEGYEKVQVPVPIDNERRAKIQPTLRTSRFNSYEARQKKWVYDEETKTGDFVDNGPSKPITLRIVESITVPVP